LAVVDVEALAAGDFEAAGVEAELVQDGGVDVAIPTVLQNSPFAPSPLFQSPRLPTDFETHEKFMPEGGESIRFGRDALPDLCEQSAAAGRVAALLARDEAGFCLTFGKDM
jgi:hypothetical protein